MSEEKFDAKVDKVSGGVKEGLGKVTGDKRTESEGKVEKATGDIKEKIADAKDTVKGAIDGLKSKNNK
ncbi:CsbD family protein [Streptococcus halotolerans]|uniref:CsbD family protein n=1 Tax=Streptococcus halotolerans TaxID=1814128 RepID=UPI000787B42B|nr:CsbD family protein [Streptococcus halotolerans]